MSSATIIATPTKSFSDDRYYRVVELSNRLSVLLVSDPTADKAAASLDVRVGHLSDPAKFPGLAHFCEHMLFMGTEKYPDENEYNTYLVSHGGGSNAYTDTEDTNYYFDVLADHFEGAIDRFAQFFVAPLFTPSATERELKAVDSENSKNCQNDFWRSFQLLKSLAREDHPFHKFGTGNLETIKDDEETGESVRDALLNFHATFYSADVMKLVLVGKETLDELQNYASKYFSDIANKDVGNPSFPGAPYPPSHLGKRIEVVPIKENRSLDLHFPLPPTRQHYHKKPANYISHLIGHESAGSIISYLKKKNYANDLWGGQARSCSDWASFQVGVDLTEEGMDHIEEITEIIFAYINMLRSSGPQEWIYKENLEVAKNNFRFLSKSKPQGYACSLAERMQNYKPDDVLSGPYFTTEYDPKLVTDILGYLTPENMILSVTGRKFKGETKLVEKWYGTEYNDMKIDSDLLSKWSEVEYPKSDLHLPEKNDLIATDFALRSPPSNHDPDQPKLIVNDDLARLWFKVDDKFGMPKLNVICTLTTPLAYQSAESLCLTQLYVACLNELINEFSYMAAMAGLNSSISNSRVGLEVSVSGFNHKLHLLMDKILVTISEFGESVTESLFDRMKEKSLKGLKNFFFNQSYHHAGNATDLILGPISFPYEERVEAMEEVTFQDLLSYSQSVLSRSFCEMLIHGNATTDEAKKFLEVIKANLKYKKLLKSSFPESRVAMLNPGTDYVHRFREYNPEEANSCVQCVFQVGCDDLEISSVLSVLCHLLSEPAFDVLRTKETLGYIVYTAKKASEHVAGVQFIIQGDANPPDYLDERVEAFLETFRGKIEDMDKEEFGRNKQAVIEKLLEKDKNLNEEFSKYYAYIVKDTYTFQRRNDLAEIIKDKVGKDTVLAFFDRYMRRGGEGRRKLTTMVYGKGVEMPEKEGGETVQIKDKGTWKHKCKLFEGVDDVEFAKFE